MTTRLFEGVPCAGTRVAFARKFDPSDTRAQAGGMGTTNAAAAAPHERLSWTEICARYPDEWVMVTEIEPDEEDEDHVGIDFDSALVLGHHPLRKEAYRITKHLAATHPSGGCFFTGKIGPLPPRFP